MIYMEKSDHIWFAYGVVCIWCIYFIYGESMDNLWIWLIYPLANVDNHMERSIILSWGNSIFRLGHVQ